MHQQDHFSSIAKQYTHGRIHYPDELYQFLSGQCRAHEVAWDCATGSGQAAIDLARYFDHVIATDISMALLDQATPHPKISYRQVEAEASGIETESVDLITIAQALHWFDLPQFWNEARRVMKPSAILAFWGYIWPEVSPDVDDVMEEFKARIASSWPERSALLHGAYASINPPFHEISAPEIITTVSWTADDYLAHLRSWSATRYYSENTGENIVETFAPVFAKAWRGDRNPVRWPLVIKVFKK